MRTRIKIVVAAVLLAVVGAGVFAASRPINPTRQPLLKVTATFYPLYDFASIIGGDKVTVTNLTPAGSEPHDYEPSPGQLADTFTSDVLIYNGASMEPWVDKFLPDYTKIAVRASDGVNLLDGGSGTGAQAHGTIKDPHFWLDPVLAEKVIDNIKSGLIKADPKDSTYFTGRADSYKAKLTALNEEFKNGLANCQTRTIITSHDAFSYLGKRYNLDIVSIAGLSPDEEPSAAKLAELSNLVKEKDIGYVFFESLASPKLAETIAHETGAKTAVFDPIEGISNADQTQGKDYLSIQQENLASLKTALACH